MKRTGLYAEGEMDEFYVSVGLKWKLNTKNAAHMQDQYLTDHAVFSANGFNMQNQNGAYIFPELGEGTVTLELAGCIRRTWNLHVMDKGEMKSIMLRSLRQQGFFQTVLGIAYGFAHAAGLFAVPAMLVTVPIAFVYLFIEYLKIVFA